MSKYIKYFPEPFLNDLIAGRCIPFIGAGFSKNAVYPSDKTMPSWEELGRQFSKKVPEYEYIGALDALSAYEHEYRRPKLIEELHRSLLVDVAQPGPTHTSFCELPFDICITTNFEFLLERTYESIKRYCRPIIDEDQLSVDSSGPEVKLLKIHGDLHHPNRLIVTEDDYDGFLDRYPLISTFLSNLLIIKTAFFIGYSLDDPDFRQIWQVILNRLGRLRRLAYTIMISASSPTIARFERRGVKVINIPGKPNEYPRILEKIFTEIREYWNDKLLETSYSTEDESLAELGMPKDAKSRLCFFSVPSKMSAFYKTFVFPVAEKYGFAPVIAMDVVSPGENISAKVSALIEKSELLIVDATTQNTVYELQLASAKKKGRIIAIVEEGSRLLIDPQHYSCLSRPSFPEESDGFINELDSLFGQFAKKIRPEFTQEPFRLLKIKEYRAAVISSVSLLESEIKNYMSFANTKHDNRYFSLKKLISFAVEYELISDKEIGKVIEWTSIRNRAVHGGTKISATIANTIVSGIMEIVGRIQNKYNNLLE